MRSDSLNSLRDLILDLALNIPGFFVERLNNFAVSRIGLHINPASASVISLIFDIDVTLRNSIQLDGTSDYVFVANKQFGSDYSFFYPIM